MSKVLGFYQVISPQNPVSGDFRVFIHWFFLCFLSREFGDSKSAEWIKCDDNVGTLRPMRTVSTGLAGMVGPVPQPPCVLVLLLKTGFNSLTPGPPSGVGTSTWLPAEGRASNTCPRGLATVWKD